MKKKSGLVGFSIAVLFILFFIIFSMFVVLGTAKTKTIKTDCYDNRGNKILDMTCEKEIYSNPEMIKFDYLSPFIMVGIVFLMTPFFAIICREYMRW